MQDISKHRKPANYTKRLYIEGGMLPAEVRPACVYMCAIEASLQQAFAAANPFILKACQLGIQVRCCSAHAVQSNGDMFNMEMHWNVAVPMQYPQMAIWSMYNDAMPVADFVSDEDMPTVHFDANNCSPTL